MLCGMRETTSIPDELSPLRTLNAGSAADWRRATTAQHSMLLEGPEAKTEVVLTLLAPFLREPVTWKRRGVPLQLPSDECGALVLQNIAGLDRPDQARLLAWLTDSTHQVVSTTAYPLFPLVSCGVFDETLYYRLNVVRFSLDEE